MIEDKLLRGRYKGVPFNFEDSSDLDGNNTVIHEYVNSKRVTSEEMGKIARTFSMNIYIHGIGEEYYAKRTAILSVLREGGEGELQHPTFGTFFAVVAKPPAVNESVSALGKAKIAVQFTVTEPLNEIKTNIYTPQKLFFQGDLLAQSKRDQMAEKYELSFLDQVKQAQKYVQDLTKKFQKATAIINDPTKLGEFVTQLAGFEKGLFTSGVDLARDTYGLFATATNFIESAEDRFNFFKDMFGFGDDEPEIPQTTLTRVGQAQNQVLQKSIVQSSALVFASYSSTEIEYQTDSELNSNSEVMQIQYIKILAADGTDSEQYNELQEQRVIFTEIMKELVLSVSRIIEEDVENIGLSTLIYQYYGVAEGSESFDTIYDLILSLNEFEETGSITGTIKMVTES